MEKALKDFDKHSSKGGFDTTLTLLRAITIRTQPEASTPSSS